MGGGRTFSFGPCLGRGSFGEVYAASMQSPGGLETRVAVKLLRADLDLGTSPVQRLRDEGRLLARLNHPGILNVIDLVHLDGRMALVTELVEGADLSAFLPTIGPRALCQALGQVAGALDAAASAEGDEGPLQLVHRDVKPSNIRVDPHGHAKLLDFGIARFDASDREARTASDLIVGSIPYMAPERFIQRDVHPSSDIFSLGCCLYQGLTRKKLYRTRKVAEISRLALDPDLYARFLQDRLAHPELDARLVGLLVDLLALDPAHRPTAAEAADRLEEATDHLDGPSLRRFCMDFAFDEPTAFDGPLEGTTLSEQQEDEEAPSGETPLLHHAPLATLEVASLEAASLPSAPGLVDLPAPSPTAPAPPVPTETLSELHPVQMHPPAPSYRGLAIAGVVGIGLIALLSIGAGATVFVTVLGALSL